MQYNLCFLLYPSPLCADCLFYVWYPVSTAPGTWTLLLLLLLRAARKMVVIVQFQSTPIYQPFLRFSIQSIQVCNSSFCNIGNLIWPKPMCHEVPWMLHELVVIYQYQISLLKGFLLDVFIMVSLFSFLLYLVMKSYNKPVFL